jgi:hypothetical protein
VTALPARYDIILQQGTTYDLPISYRDSAGTPIDLSGYNALIQVRELPNFPIIVEFNSALTSNGFIFLTGPAEDREDGANGNLRVFLSAANSSVLNALVARYQLNITDNEGFVTPLIEGSFTVQGSVTVQGSPTP